MKITEIASYPLIWKCPVPIADAVGTSACRKALLVEIRTDKGISGLGEVFLYGASINGARAILEEQIAPLLIGQDAEKIEYIYNRMLWATMASGRRGIVLGVISGIDTALWDIRGKAENAPVGSIIAKELGNKPLSVIPSYASGGFYAEGKGLDGLKMEIEGYLEKGYRAVKIKAGRNPERPDSPLRYIPYSLPGVSEEEDMERIRTAKSLIGDRDLFVDLNASFSPEKALDWVPFLKETGVSWLEEPIRFEYCSEMAELQKKLYPAKIAGFETEQGEENFHRLLEMDAVEVVQADIGWAGGFTGCIRIAEDARKHGKPFSLHSFGSAVHFAASLQLAAGLSNTEMIESEENQNMLRSGIANEPFETDGSMGFLVPGKSGIGITLDMDRIESLIAR